MKPSIDPAARRRLVALAAAAGVALIAGVVVGVPWGGDSGKRSGRSERELAPIPKGLTLEQQVGQLLVLSFPGRRVPPSVAAAMRGRRAAGMVLFSGNVAGPGVVRRLTAELQRDAGGGALVATDQEGGDVRILPFAASPQPQSAQVGASAARAAARASARDLSAVGVNVDLAPVADVGTPGAALGGRFYPGGPGEVAASVRAAVAEYGRGRIGATVKHFPGFGAARANTDDAPVTIGLPRARLERDLEPFRSAIAAGTPLVMVSHALYPALDRGRIASQSPAIIGGLLRGRLGYRNVVITDSLEAQAVLSRSSVAAAAERSIAAGVDLLLLTGSGSYGPVYRRLLARARSSAAFRRRVREALGRVLALKRRLGLRPVLEVR